MEVPAEELEKLTEMKTACWARFVRLGSLNPRIWEILGNNSQDLQLLEKINMNEKKILSIG